jgi:hypothetical protein
MAFWCKRRIGKRGRVSFCVEKAKKEAWMHCKGELG